jgi:hypothetical protein
VAISATIPQSIMKDWHRLHLALMKES